MPLAHFECWAACMWYFFVFSPAYETTFFYDLFCEATPWILIPFTFIYNSIEPSHSKFLFAKISQRRISRLDYLKWNDQTDNTVIQGKPDQPNRFACKKTIYRTKHQALRIKHFHPRTLFVQSKTQYLSLHLKVRSLAKVHCAISPQVSPTDLVCLSLNLLHEANLEARATKPCHSFILHCALSLPLAKNHVDSKWPTNNATNSTKT